MRSPNPLESDESAPGLPNGLAARRCRGDTGRIGIACAAAMSRPPFLRRSLSSELYEFEAESAPELLDCGVLCRSASSSPPLDLRRS